MPAKKPLFTSPPFRQLFNRLVWEIVERVPRGKIITYGQIAALIPRPKAVGAKHFNVAKARWVGNAMASCPGGLPWHRVINAQGRISVRSKNNYHIKQRILLESEGIVFDERDRIDLEQFGWKPR